MPDAYLTVTGWVGNEPTHTVAGESALTTFRLGSTPRFFSRDKGWRDGTTAWYTVKAWRSLADNVAASVHKGEALVVHGRLEVETWVDRDGVEQTTLVLTASTVGHDLGRGRSTFVKSTREAVDRAEADDVVREQIRAQAQVRPQLDSSGEPCETAGDWGAPSTETAA